MTPTDLTNNKYLFNVPMSFIKYSQNGIMFQISQKDLGQTIKFIEV